MKEYIGKTVELIYIDRHRNVTFRLVRVMSIRDGMIKAFCFTANAPRVFKAENIVDLELVKHVI